MSNRFHNKFHRHNHHTLPTDREGLYPDSAYDPIASPEVPFQGSFNLSGNFVCLSSAFIKDTITAPYAEFGNVQINQNLTVLGDTTRLDTYVFCYSAVDINCTGNFTAFNVTQNANYRVAKFTNYYDNSVVIDANSQVGIGTVNPEAQIHIIETDSAKTSKVFVDNIFSNSLLRLKAPVLSDLQFNNPYGSYANIIGTAALSSLTFKTNSLERITVTSNGNVGIATTAPTVRLDVNGNTRIIANDGTPDVGALTIVKPSSAFITSDIFVNTYANRVIGYDPYQGNIGGGLRIRTAGGTYDTPTSTLSGRIGYVVAASTHDGITWKNSSIINLGIESNATIDNHNSYISFETLSGGFTSSRTEKVRITSKGRVGIGTIDPTGLSSPLSAEGHSLHVYNNTNDGTSTNSNTVIVAESVNRSAYFLASVTGNGGTGGLTVKRSSDAVHLGRVVVDSTSTTLFQAGVGNVSDLKETMRILSGGNVGIGTATPVFKLDVAGDIGSHNIYCGNIYSGVQAVTADAAIEVGIQRTGNGNAYVDLHSAPGNDYESRLFRSAGINGDLYLLNKGTGYLKLWQENAADIVLGTSDAERFRITNNGNVGIGLSNPVAKLELVGDFVTAANNYYSSNLYYDGTNWRYRNNGVAGLIKLADNSGGVVINTATNNYSGGGTIATVAERIRINAETGNIGIGTQTPNEKLTVVGNISSNGELINLYNPNGEAAINIKSDGASGSSILRLNNGIDNTTRARIVWQKNDLPYARIYGYDSLSALSIETENVERVRFSKNGTNLYGNLTIQGDLSSTGNQYFTNTFFTTTSAISVVNISPASDIPALYIGQSGPGDIASFYDLDQGVEVLHVGGANGTYPNVGIKTSEPNKDLTVRGEISASGTIWETTGNSNWWNSVFNLVQSLSASWQGTGQLYANTVEISASSTITLAQNSIDIEIVPAATTVTEVTAFDGGVKGITYTLTNKTLEPITIYSSPNIIIRRGNAWISNTTTLSGAYLVLPLSGSCSVRAGGSFVSIW